MHGVAFIQMCISFPVSVKFLKQKDVRHTAHFKKSVVMNSIASLHNAYKITMQTRNNFNTSYVSTESHIAN